MFAATPQMDRAAAARTAIAVSQAEAEEKCGRNEKGSPHLVGS